MMDSELAALMPNNLEKKEHTSPLDTDELRNYIKEHEVLTERNNLPPQDPKMARRHYISGLQPGARVPRAPQARRFSIRVKKQDTIPTTALNDSQLDPEELKDALLQQAIAQRRALVAASLRPGSGRVVKPAPFNIVITLPPVVEPEVADPSTSTEKNSPSIPGLRHYPSPMEGVLERPVVIPPVTAVDMHANDIFNNDDAPIEGFIHERASGPAPPSVADGFAFATNDDNHAFNNDNNNNDDYDDDFGGYDGGNWGGDDDDGGNWAAAMDGDNDAAMMPPPPPPSAFPSSFDAMTMRPPPPRKPRQPPRNPGIRLKNELPRKSLALDPDVGRREVAPGIRRTTRHAQEPLKWWLGEKKEFDRIAHKTMPTVIHVTQADLNTPWRTIADPRTWKKSRKNYSKNNSSNNSRGGKGSKSDDDGKRKRGCGAASVTAGAALAKKKRAQHRLKKQQQQMGREEEEEEEQGAAEKRCKNNGEEASLPSPSSEGHGLDDSDSDIDVAPMQSMEDSDALDKDVPANIVASEIEINEEMNDMDIVDKSIDGASTLETAAMIVPGVGDTQEKEVVALAPSSSSPSPAVAIGDDVIVASTLPEKEEGEQQEQPNTMHIDDVDTIKEGNGTELAAAEEEKAEEEDTTAPLPNVAATLVDNKPVPSSPTPSPSNRTKRQHPIEDTVIDDEIILTGIVNGPNSTPVSITVAGTMNAIVADGKATPASVTAGPRRLTHIEEDEEAGGDEDEIFITARSAPIQTEGGGGGDSIMNDENDAAPSPTILRIDDGEKNVADDTADDALHTTSTLNTGLVMASVSLEEVEGETRHGVVNDDNNNNEEDEDDEIIIKAMHADDGADAPLLLEEEEEEGLTPLPAEKREEEEEGEHQQENEHHHSTQGKGHVDGEAGGVAERRSLRTRNRGTRQQ